MYRAVSQRLCDNGLLNTGVLNFGLKFYPRKYQRKSKFNKKKTEEEKDSAKPLDYDSLIEDIKGTTLIWIFKNVYEEFFSPFDRT